MRFRFIDAEKATFPISVLCRVMRVSRSGYYAWRCRPPSQRARLDARLAQHIERSHRDSRGTYGSPRVLRDLRDEGLYVSRKRVARIMRQLGIQGCQPRRYRTTTESNHDRPVAPNHLDRNFAATAPNQKWATDITYVRTWRGWLYCAVVIDLYSRRVVGWATAPHLRTELVLDALHRALGRRLPGTDLVHHSDRGCQYASRDYQATLAEHGITCSMSRRGNCYDNAVVESFFATLKNELLYRRAWPTHEEATLAIADYIELFYNSRRRHSTLGYQSPLSFELTGTQQQKAA